MRGSDRAGTPVVSAEEAREAPYPYVYAESDGSVRELHAAERAYLEEPFVVGDGGRPYVKLHFAGRDGWGSLAGFCARAGLPPGTRVASPPAENPNPPMTLDDLAAALEREGLTVQRSGGEGEETRSSRIEPN